MISPEEFFLSYGFPCANVLLQAGTITEERYKELETAAKSKIPVSKEILESSFPAAFRRIKKLAKEMKIKNYWDIRVLKEYWYKNHNINIDEKEGNYSKFPESFCDFCKTHIAEIIKILPDNFVLIKYGNKKRPVSVDYIQNPKVGDRVRIHHAYAIEKIT